jgi:hypothetical protein
MIAEAALPALAAWANFYVMVGSSAAALTGLMFVVITLVTDSERERRSRDGISTFSTPTVMHFCAALFVSAVLSAPWHLLIHPAILLALGGAYSIVYIVRIMLRTRRLDGYTADLEDWVWYTVMPFVAYGTIFAGALALPIIPVDALFALGAGALLLIFIGIRNSWDVVTFLAIEVVGKAARSSENDKSGG